MLKSRHKDTLLFIVNGTGRCRPAPPAELQRKKLNFMQMYFDTTQATTRRQPITLIVIPTEAEAWSCLLLPLTRRLGIASSTDASILHWDQKLCSKKNNNFLMCSMATTSGNNCPAGAENVNYIFNASHPQNYNEHLPLCELKTILWLVYVTKGSY